MDDNEIREILTEKLSEERFGVLTTVGEGGRPHATIVCFVIADRLASAVFLTPRSTRKFRNLSAAGVASLFIEARGTVATLDDVAAAPYRPLFRRKYPELADFGTSPGVAWCRIDIERYDVVHRFQEVVVFRPGANR